MRAFAELNEQGTKIEVHFKYDPNAVEAIREVTGRRFVDTVRDGRRVRFWTVPLDLASARDLRQAFGQGLVLGDALKEWGREATRAERRLGKIAEADDAQLSRVRPERAAWLRAYQRADVAMMANASVLNANQPGVGKTVETIYAVEEAGSRGPHLVVAPISNHKDPWVDELTEHAPHARVFWGETPAERKRAMLAALGAIQNGERDVWLIVNPEMVRVAKLDPDAEDDGRRVLSKDHKGNAYVAKDAEQALLFEVEWATVTTDEFHKYGLGADRNTLFARGLNALARRAHRRYALSGTPMAGKPVRLWGVLHFIDPDRYPGKWKWAQQWLTNADGSGPVDPGAGTGIGGLIPGREDAFYKAHSNVMIRRDRADALPGLPPKVRLDVRTPMTKKQRAAYDRFAESSEVLLDGGRVSSDGILAEFARLKQLANALCRVDDRGDLQPVAEESGKLPILLTKLDTYGIRPAADDPEPGARAIVASESKRMARATAEWLTKQGLNVRVLDGAVTGRDRNDVIDWYKAPTEDARVLVATTQTGGVGLNLGMTGSIHILDETWNPDDQEQLEDRGMRNRTTPLMVLYYRTEDSIQEYIEEVCGGKAINNAAILELKNRLRSRS